MKFRWETDCTLSDADSVIAMCEVARQVQLATFQRRCDWQAWAAALGYDRHFPLRRDWHVSYFRSRYRGKPCYYAQHSAIEHIFTQE